ncbi:MAG: hypothetical protein QOF70_7219 [Acetobacteraceae bacterium]|jgi:hypothetical protein|nr:hypothetical protein [Acetobacteraceae bacterium]
MQDQIPFLAGAPGPMFMPRPAPGRLRRSSGGSLTTLTLENAIADPASIGSKQIEPGRRNTDHVVDERPEQVLPDVDNRHWAVA